MDELGHLTAFLISFLTLSFSWHLDLMTFHQKDNTKLRLHKRLDVVKILQEENVSGLNLLVLWKRQD